MNSKAPHSVRPAMSLDAQEELHERVSSRLTDTGRFDLNQLLAEAMVQGRSLEQPVMNKPEPKSSHLASGVLWAALGVMLATGVALAGWIFAAGAQNAKADNTAAMVAAQNQLLQVHEAQISSVKENQAGFVAGNAAEHRSFGESLKRIEHKLGTDK